MITFTDRHLLKNNSCCIYQILNTTNNKSYIGSTRGCALTRISQHYSLLLSQKHSNKYLQKSFNKYGENVFTINILANNVIKELLLETEDFFIRQFQTNNHKYGYNLVLPMNNLTYFSKLPTEFWKEYPLWVNGNINDEELSVKQLSVYTSRKNIVPWNKGKTMSKEHCEKLSNAAKNRVCSEQGKLARRKACRDKAPSVKVYYIKKGVKTFIKEYTSSKDLEELSMDKSFELTSYMTLKNKIGRNGYYPHVLKTYNINKSSRNKTPYKGLYFELE